MTAADADGFGDLQRDIDEFEPKRKLYDALKKRIEAAHAELPADEPFTLEGKRYTVQISPKRWERRITAMPRLFRLLKQARFLQLCTFPLSSLDKEELSERDVQAIVTKEQSGGRSIKAVLKAAEARAA